MASAANAVANPNAVAVTQVAYNAGFRGNALTNAVAIALAESGGNPAAINDNPKTGDYSVGLWQINYYGALGPARTKQFGAPNKLLGANPLGPEANANAKAAFALSGGGKTWSPWQADFNNGSFYNHYPEAQSAVVQFMGGATAPGAVGSPSGGLISAGSDPNSLLNVAANNPATPTTSPDDHCIIHLGATGSAIPLIGPLLTDSGPCILSTSNVRAIGGTLLIAAGVTIGGLGVVLLMGRNVDLTAIAGKVSPEGYLKGIAATRSVTPKRTRRLAQDETDDDVEHARKMTEAQDREGQRKRAASGRRNLAATRKSKAPDNEVF